MTFFEALPILKNGFLACLLASGICAFVGVYVILRRIVFVSAALTQVSSLGIATALLMSAVLGYAGIQEDYQKGWTLIAGLVSLLFAVLASGLLAIHTTERKITRESLLGIGYILPGALVLIALDIVSGETHLIENILFGNAVFVPTSLLIWLVVSGGLVLLVHWLFYKEFVFVAFDPDTARASGIRIGLYNQLFFLTLALIISVSIAAIGAMPVFGFMVMPAAAALIVVNRLKAALLFSVGIGITSALGGFYLSFIYDLPTGPTMLAVCGLWLAAAAFAKGLIAIAVTKRSSG